MSFPRFLIHPLPSEGQVLLDAHESRHASNVLRLTAGDSVFLFDGQGGEALGVLEESNPKAVTVRIVERTDRNCELRVSLSLLVALPKGDRQRALVDGLVQLGVHALTPLICARGVAQPTGNALERLQRHVVESSKQCGRNLLMQIAPPIRASDLPNAFPADTLSLVAHPYGANRTLNDMRSELASVRSIQAAIGPEGGFTDEEIEIFRERNWQPVSLGPRILRIEMAAIAIAAWHASNDAHP